MTHRFANFLEIRITAQLWFTLKKEKVKNLLIYDAVNKILNKNKILAPKLINQNYKNNYIEVEDFGDNTLYKLLRHNKTNKEFFFYKNFKNS